MLHDSNLGHIGDCLFKFSNIVTGHQGALLGGPLTVTIVVAVTFSHMETRTTEPLLAVVFRSAVDITDEPGGASASRAVSLRGMTAGRAPPQAAQLARP